MKKIYSQPRVEVAAAEANQMLCISGGGIRAQISGYKAGTSGGFSQTPPYIWLAGIICSSLLFLGTACSTNAPDQPKQQAELKPRTLVVQQSVVGSQQSAARRLPQATITDKGGTLDAIWSAGDEISFRNLSHETYTVPETGNLVSLEGVLIADRAARIASFASNNKVWCDVDDQLLLVYPKATAPAFSVSGSPLTATYNISMTGQDGTLATIANTYHYSYGIAKVYEVTETTANAELAEMQNLLTVCKFSFVDAAIPETPLPIASLSIAYGDTHAYSGTYPESATVAVTKGDPCTATVTPANKEKAAGGYALSIVPSGDLTAVYVALFPETSDTKYTFTLKSGDDTYTGTAKAQLNAGEFVVATGLKLKKN